MATRERQGWILVASLFVTLFLVFGSGYNTSSLFFPQLLSHFKWTHTRTAWLTSALALSAGFSGPLIGVLLDRIEARIVMVVGVILSALAFFVASRADSFNVMLAAYLVLGIGIAAATLLPASLVIANWFGARRGIAMGLTFAGTSLGGAGMVQVGNYAIIHFGGWRAAYVTLAVPMIVIVVPLILWKVRSRPPEARKEDFQASGDALPGLELSEALRTRSFWMISAAQFLYACVAAGAGLHLIHHLINLGYTPTFAATMMSLIFTCASVGKLGMGAFSDRVSARVALAVNFIGAAIGLALIFGASNGLMLVLFVLVFGLTLGAPLVLIPLLAVESMGLKRFGSIGGIAGVFNTLGAAVGPVAAGQIFDVFGSYTAAFDAFIILSILGALATLSCLTLEVEQARLAPSQVAAALVD
ncbi:MAG: MFS transporter [Candidatus Binataceae bacterium]